MSREDDFVFEDEYEEEDDDEFEDDDEDDEDDDEEDEDEEEESIAPGVLQRLSISGGGTSTFPMTPISTTFAPINNQALPRATFSLFPTASNAPPPQTSAGSRPPVLEIVDETAAISVPPSATSIPTFISQRPPSFAARAITPPTQTMTPATLQTTFGRAQVPFNVPTFASASTEPPIEVLAKYLVPMEGEEKERFNVRRHITLALISDPWAMSSDAALKAGYLLAQQLFLGTVYDQETQVALSYIQSRISSTIRV